MPRKKRNARRIKKTRKLHYKHAVLVHFDRRTVERMSPGRLVAVAEWR